VAERLGLSVRQVEPNNGSRTNRGLGADHTVVLHSERMRGWRFVRRPRDRRLAGKTFEPASHENVPTTLQLRNVSTGATGARGYALTSHQMISSRRERPTWPSSENQLTTRATSLATSQSAARQNFSKSSTNGVWNTIKRLCPKSTHLPPPPHSATFWPAGGGYGSFESGWHLLAVASKVVGTFWLGLLPPLR
jgi:hypothetical protein